MVICNEEEKKVCETCGREAGHNLEVRDDWVGTLWRMLCEDCYQEED